MLLDSSAKHFIFLLGVAFFNATFTAYAIETPSSLNIWSANYNQPHHIALIEAALSRAEEKYGVITLTPSEAENQDSAFRLLAQNTPQFDAVISALETNRENEYDVIYIPFSRGLLGFRLCLISPELQTTFQNVNRPADFSKLALNVVMSPYWPDDIVMQNNGIPTTYGSSERERIESIDKQTGHCYSRSLIEIGEEQQRFQHLSIESSLIMIYPLADVIYFRKGSATLRQAIQYGIEQLIEDGTYSDLFYQYYGELFAQFNVYERKILFLANPDLSDKARSAINTFGVASFILPAD